ncbi:uncharacterized protein LOC113238869, partial [Hyposmocoma kahamanoa]|uniref:uncharacterized protein LOC113238869 n=1 Tax=Hyposmocoma kahamanoa TaxID=1477025 RepID=UPI000E6D8EA6
MKISVTSHYIYYRIFGYITTIIMHLVNIWCMTRRFQGDHKDSTIRFFLGNQMIFFTGWTFILQIVYAVAGLMCDLLTLKNANNNDYKLNKHLRGFRDVLFAGIQWPSSL